MLAILMYCNLLQSTALGVTLQNCPQITEWSLLALSHVKGDLSIDVRSTGVGFIPEKLRALVSSTQTGTDTETAENQEGEQANSKR